MSRRGRCTACHAYLECRRFDGEWLCGDEDQCAARVKLGRRFLQQQVWAAYNLGQEEGSAAVSRVYLDVTTEAIRIVAEKERRNG